MRLRLDIGAEEGVMSLADGSAETAHWTPPAAAGRGAAAYAPKRLREDARAAHKVVPLRLPAAPQLVPADTPAPVEATVRRPTGPELLAEDEVLKRLLARHSPDPAPLAVKPTRDRAGLALGMVARLIVFGCAVAFVALVVGGVIPLPARLAGSSEAVAPAAPVAAAPAAAAQPSIAAPPANRVTTVTVHAAAAVSAAPAAQPAAWELDAAEAGRLAKRGEEYLAQGDIAAARLVLARAAAAHDAHAALSLGATYDPAVLRHLHVLGFQPDVAQARAWYEKAAEYGSTDAAARIAALPGAGH
jgi:hypothetical protein